MSFARHSISELAGCILVLDSDSVYRPGFARIQCFTLAFLPKLTVSCLMPGVYTYGLFCRQVFPSLIWFLWFQPRI